MNLYRFVFTAAAFGALIAPCLADDPNGGYFAGLPTVATRDLAQSRTRNEPCAERGRPVSGRQNVTVAKR